MFERGSAEFRTICVLMLWSLFSISGKWYMTLTMWWGRKDEWETIWGGPMRCYIAFWGTQHIWRTHWKNSDWFMIFFCIYIFGIHFSYQDTSLESLWRSRKCTAVWESSQIAFQWSSVCSELLTSSASQMWKEESSRSECWSDTKSHKPNT